MRTLYALTFVLLFSTSSIADVLDITPTGVDDDSTATISTPTLQPIERAVESYVEEYNAEPATPVIKPIDAADVQIAADETDMPDEYMQTAAVPSAGSSKIEERSMILDVDFSVENETGGFDLE
jgi:hypothetical protein